MDKEKIVKLFEDEGHFEASACADIVLAQLLPTFNEQLAYIMSRLEMYILSIEGDKIETATFLFDNLIEGLKKED